MILTLLQYLLRYTIYELVDKASFCHLLSHTYFSFIASHKSLHTSHIQDLILLPTFIAYSSLYRLSYFHSHHSFHAKSSTKPLDTTHHLIKSIILTCFISIHYLQQHNSLLLVPLTITLHSIHPNSYLYIIPTPLSTHCNRSPQNLLNYK